MMAMYKEEKRLEDLYENGQITAIDLEVGRLKLIRQDEINMFREDGDEAEAQSAELPKGNEREGTP